MNLKELKRTEFIVGAFLVFVLTLAGCWKSPVMPENINSDDACYFCKSPIAEPEYAAEFLTASGSVHKFDDMVCLIASARVTGKDNIKSIYVMAADLKTWAPAEQVTFVRSDKLRTPKNGGLIAFKDPSKAQDLASRYQAELVKLDDLIK
jgi:copper chaperone NosL